jgi:2-isopropylmalate synthase
MGYEFDSDEEFQSLFTRFKELCDKKKRIDDRDIEALIAGESQRVPEVYRLEHVQVSSGTNLTPTATVRITGHDSVTITQTAFGTGPVDAIYKAINSIVQRPNELMEFAINAVTEGIDAVAEVSVRIRELGAEGDEEHPARPVVYSGYSVNTDTLVAAAEAYMAALNKLLDARRARARAEDAAYAAGYDPQSPSYATDSFAVRGSAD